MANCPNCGKQFSSSGLKSHLRSSKSCSNTTNQIVEEPELETESNSQPEAYIPEDKQTEPVKEPEQPKNEENTEDIPDIKTFTSDWLKEAKQELSEVKKESATSSESPSIEDLKVNTTFSISIEQYAGFFRMINTVLDFFVTLAGGDETFSKMNEKILNEIANNTKLYFDSKNIKVSPFVMFASSLLIGYSIPFGSAMKSIKDNHKLASESNLSIKELQELRELQKGMKITKTDNGGL